MSNTENQALEFGFQPGDVVQEWLWDDDVDEDLRAELEDYLGEELVDEEYDSGVDGVILWWRDGDDEDELADTIVDAMSLLNEGAPFWVLTPKPGREGAIGPNTLQNAAKTAGMNAATPETVGPDWNGIRLRAFGRGRERER
ncbi:hypothetical protein B9G54_06790 [Alloscardovia macacae]|uniref:DUF3052 domain-containing protein n=1 Tax=Alloscardovia macacae TaxID=1160091 RepID=A0A1Y2T0R4_9BIFI|nr:DUF3052 domain-containing protein [Alloscardovia macacae]OTA25858.1 hypothetical protein B9G54_06790 [Alloscardovia macacae]OTA28660.1 hypothetical protein B9T39_06080 [Alloscardovia macacae]